MAMFNSYVANYQGVTFIVEIYIGSYQPSGWCQSLSVSKSWWSKVAEHKRICQAGYQRNWSVVYLLLWKIWKSVGIILLNIWKKKCSKPPTRKNTSIPDQTPNIPCDAKCICSVLGSVSITLRVTEFVRGSFWQVSTTMFLPPPLPMWPTWLVTPLAERKCTKTNERSGAMRGY